MIFRLKSYASIILGMAKESFDPISVGEALLQGVAIPAVMHGTEVVLSLIHI